MGTDSSIDLRIARHQAALQGAWLKLLETKELLPNLGHQDQRGRAARWRPSVSEIQTWLHFVLSCVMSAARSSENQRKKVNTKYCLYRVSSEHWNIFMTKFIQYTAISGVCVLCKCVCTLSSSSISEIFLSRALLSCRGEEKEKADEEDEGAADLQNWVTTQVAQTHTLCDAELTRCNETRRVCGYSTRTYTQTHSSASMVTGFTRRFSQMKVVQQ